MTTLTETGAERLTEHVGDWRAEGFAVDRDRRLVRGVALTGTQSKNGYRYAEAALRESLPLYEHKPVFLDHAPNAARPHERSTRDLVGSIVEPRFEEDRVRADVRVLDTDAGRTFLALVEANGPAVGMSHVVLAERSADRNLVEHIRDVVCVDAVVFPATTSTFRESTEVVDDAASVVDLQQQLDEAIRERDALREQLDRLEVERRSSAERERIEALIEDAKLPAFAVTELFREQLRSASDDAARRRLITERRALLEQVRVPHPTSRKRREVTDGCDDDRIVAALRGTGSSVMARAA